MSKDFCIFLGIFIFIFGFLFGGCYAEWNYKNEIKKDLSYNNLNLSREDLDPLEKDIALMRSLYEQGKKPVITWSER